ncbi:MAG: hypothetical protein ACP5D5_08890 [Acidithiobacillus sp.]|uniref:hypothetical protein n=1 Tax=Acidithiobacillus sp. TaxID=1872118 RepID=UPI003D03B419
MSTLDSTFEGINPVVADPKGRKKPEGKGKRVRILISEGSEQDLPYVFVGVNGQSYQISRGEEVDVPVEVLEVLDNAVTVTYVKTKDRKQVARRQLRFPYRVIQENV